MRGARALVAAVGLRAKVRAARRPGWPVVIESTRLGLRGEVGPDLELRGPGELEPLAAVLRALRRLGVEPVPAEVRVGGDLPPGAGLGSSAAVTAAAALAYSALAGVELGPGELFEAALEGERVVHERPSGVDTAIAVHGGVLLYRRGGEPQRLGLSLPGGTVLVVADSGVKRRTGDVVRHVLSRAALTEPASGLVYRAADALVDLALEAMGSGDAERLGAAFDLAHGLLAGLGASSPDLDRIVHAARGAGAYGAKLTGAGWGGSAIALAPAGAAGRVACAMIRAGAAWAGPVEVGVEGARLEAVE